MAHNTYPGQVKKDAVGGGDAHVLGAGLHGAANRHDLLAILHKGNPGHGDVT